MKAFSRAGLLALALAAVPSLAQAWCLPSVKLNGGINAHLNGCIGGLSFGPSAGPWYMYYPYNAYFQNPAPVCGAWPYWPAPAAAPAPALPATEAPAGEQSGLAGPTDLQPAGYTAPPPSYWYDR